MCFAMLTDSFCLIIILENEIQKVKQLYFPIVEQYGFAKVSELYRSEFYGMCSLSLHSLIEDRGNI